MVKLPRWVLIFIIIIISLVWVGSFVAGLVVDNYSPPESINLVFSAMVAALLAQLGRNNDNGGGDDGP